MNERRPDTLDVFILDKMTSFSAGGALIYEIITRDVVKGGGGRRGRVPLGQGRGNRGGGSGGNLPHNFEAVGRRPPPQL